MKFVSTNKTGEGVSFRQAVLSNVPNDGGLFLPEILPKLSQVELDAVSTSDFSGVARIVLGKLLGDEIPADDLAGICSRAFPFDTPVKLFSDELSVLELFHGPTLAFKDVGVRFMAEALHYFSEGGERVILTATSGDTGAAVAGAFFKKPGIRVIVLYPHGKISGFQEQQIAGLGENILAYAVEGSFDDCQRMVNAAFADRALVEKYKLTSANSINPARLLPQVSYYARAWAQLRKLSDLDLLFSVPSGNFGNVTAALIAREMGIPIKRILAATNSNDVVPRYLSGQEYQVKKVHQTLTTAMDIAAPNNFSRIEALFGPGSVRISGHLESVSLSDEETKQGMKELYSQFNYISDPHGALAYMGAKSLGGSDKKLMKVFLETAHPSKFEDIVRDALGVEVEIPSASKALAATTIVPQIISPESDALLGIIKS